MPRSYYADAIGGFGWLLGRYCKVVTVFVRGGGGGLLSGLLCAILAGNFILSNAAWVLSLRMGNKFIPGYFKLVTGPVSHLVAR